MGQPGKTLATTLTPIDVVKADWLSKGGGNAKPVVSTTKAMVEKPRPVLTVSTNNSGEMQEFVVDPNTKTTYLKGKFLGKGGFARVHEFTDLTTGQVYAAKIIPKSRLTKPHQKEKILREIDLHRQLQHRHVVRFQHFFEDEGNVYIILENCPRKSLVHVLKNRKVLTDPEVRYFMLQLAEGVKYIHSQGVIHRDLKLGNMFLSEEMEVKIGDFGLATHVRNIDTAGKQFNVCGTPNYIAPEVLNMQGHGFAADVWAMGCIMYAMLVGQPPFETATLSETYCRITSNKYSLPNSLTDTARHLIVKMLQSKPSERPTLAEIIQHKYFSSGQVPASLPTSCCIAIPKFPVLALINRTTVSDNVIGKVTNNLNNLQLSPKSEKQETKIQPKIEQVTRSPKKDNCFPTNLRQKLTNVLCPDKAKKSKQNCVTLAMYNMILNTLDSMPKGAKANPTSICNDLNPFITKWIDYSNKYGFGFQLSDRSIGVLFNDRTKMSLTADRTRVEFHDTCGKMTVHSPTSIPSNLQESYTLLNYFTQYMDENLTEGGELQSKELVRKKNMVPHMKRWVRSSYAIVMQLSSGTLQINFFKDHTKIVISGEHPNGLVMYINEDRQSNTFSLSDISQYGCEPNIRSRLQYAAGMLHDFLELESDVA